MLIKHYHNNPVNKKIMIILVHMQSRSDVDLEENYPITKRVRNILYLRFISKYLNVFFFLCCLFIYAMSLSNFSGMQYGMIADVKWCNTECGITETVKNSLIFLKHLPTRWERRQKTRFTLKIKEDVGVPLLPCQLRAS